MVTSVTPDAFANFRWVTVYPFIKAATYNAAAATLAGPFPTTTFAFFAFWRSLIARFCVFWLSPAIDAILDTYFMGASIGIFKSSSRWRRW